MRLRLRHAHAMHGVELETTASNGIAYAQLLQIQIESTSTSSITIEIDSAQNAVAAGALGLCNRTKQWNEPQLAFSSALTDTSNRSPFACANYILYRRSTSYRAVVGKS